MDSLLGAKGRLTIPKAVRDRLHLKPGDRVKFFFHPDGGVVILPKTKTSALKGLVSLRGSRLSAREGLRSRLE